MRFTLLIILACLFSVQAAAQQDTSEKAVITVAAMYNSNVNYYGQSTNDKLPYVLLNATMRFPVGLYISAGSYKLLNYGRGLSETDLGLGFDHDFNNKVNMGFAYTRSFFPANSPLLQASNENNVNLSGSYSWTLMKSALSADYAFGKQNDVFLSLNNSKEIILGSLFNNKNSIYIEPALELVAGTRHFYKTYIVAKEKHNQGKGVTPLSPGNSGNGTATTATAESGSFNILSYNFKLPLSLSRASYIAEVSYQFSILGPEAEAELKQRQSYFGVSFYYQF
jgi:hypothetical protein